VLPVRERLARALIQLDRETRRADGWFTIRLSQVELAELVGAARNAVVAELTVLRGAGIVATGRRQITAGRTRWVVRAAAVGVDRHFPSRGVCAGSVGAGGPTGGQVDREVVRSLADVGVDYARPLGRLGRGAPE
jgi:hypothetical protein